MKRRGRLFRQKMDIDVDGIKRREMRTSNCNHNWEEPASAKSLSIAREGRRSSHMLGWLAYRAQVQSVPLLLNCSLEE